MPSTSLAARYPFTRSTNGYHLYGSTNALTSLGILAMRMSFSFASPFLGVKLLELLLLEVFSCLTSYFLANLNPLLAYSECSTCPSPPATFEVLFVPKATGPSLLVSSCVVVLTSRKLLLLLLGGLLCISPINIITIK